MKNRNFVTNFQFNLSQSFFNNTQGLLKLNSVKLVKFSNPSEFMVKFSIESIPMQITRLIFPNLLALTFDVYQDTDNHRRR